MKSILKQKIEQGLIKKVNLLNYRDLLLEFKEKGGSQEDAIGILNDLRVSATNEDTDDRILEILYFATGWCNIELKVW